MLPKIVHMSYKFQISLISSISFILKHIYVYLVSALYYFSENRENQVQDKTEEQIITQEQVKNFLAESKSNQKLLQSFVQIFPS